jgi:hypothetical protein
VLPARITLLAAGTGIGAPLTDISTGAVDEGAISLLLGAANDPSAGWMKAQLFSDGGQSALACAALPDAAASGKTMVMCLGQSPGELADHTALLMVSQTAQ